MLHVQIMTQEQKLLPAFIIVVVFVVVVSVTYAVVFAVPVVTFGLK